MNVKDVKLVFTEDHKIRTKKLNGIVLHHAAAKEATVEKVHEWHKARGWIGIGYHFYVRKDGTVYRGRPENCVGAHTVNHNETKLGICAEGNFEEETMSAAQKNAIIELLENIRSRYGDLEIYGHRDLAATACPGKNYPFNDIVKGVGAEIVSPPKEENKPNQEGKKVNITMNVLRKDDKGYQVKTLQRILHSMGYDLGANPIDGIFGGKTDAAVRNFQKKNDLVVDGIVGEKTWAKLLKG